MTGQALIDTTEMYLRTIFELQEEGIVPLRARIAERLGQSGPTVSQTVARMERVGLLRVHGDRHLELTSDGREYAVRVMRKHRLAERLLVDVIGLAWEEVHVEACRWEHVISESVERRLVDLLQHPTTCPHGNPIPGLVELGEPAEIVVDHPEPLAAMADVATPTGIRATIRRISEQLQKDIPLMLTLRQNGIQPGADVVLVASEDGVLVRRDDNTDGVELGRPVAGHLFVAKA